MVIGFHPSHQTTEVKYVATVQNSQNSQNIHSIRFIVQQTYIAIENRAVFIKLEVFVTS